MMTKIPVGGVIWLVAQYAEGFRRLGFEPHYVEAHGRVPSMFMEHATDDPTPKAVAFIDRTMRRFGMGSHWAFHAVHDDGACYGMSEADLRRLYKDAALILNMHGGTVPLPEHADRGRLVYLGTDPVQTELEVHRGEQQAIDFLEPHVAFFTWGLNYGNPDCSLPVSDRFPMRASPPPVVMDWWWQSRVRDSTTFTTVGNWRQHWRALEFEGDTYTWSKHHEFLKVLDLPTRVAQTFELALSSYEPEDRSVLEAHGWGVRDALDVSLDPDDYRKFIRSSRGEFCVAKDQNIRFRTGWFSERSATYLAASRPVVLQDTGFGAYLPTGEGLLPFADIDQAAGAIEAVNADYARHRQAAHTIASEFLSDDVVLPPLLEAVGESPPRRRRRPAAALDLEPVSRRPFQLPTETVQAVLAAPVPRFPPAVPAGEAAPLASIVVVTYNNLSCTRLALESVLSSTDTPFELIVVDNASADGTLDYLEALASRHPHMTVLANGTNTGFAAANNRGLDAARGESLVLLNNDAIVPPRWLPRLLAHLDDATVGLIGPVTNRIGNEAEIVADYRTYGQFLEFAEERYLAFRGASFDVDRLALFCTALRRPVFERLGPLDERFGIGTLEDDDYSMSTRHAGLRVVCAEDVFVHHFGQASFGDLVRTGEYGALQERNRAYLEDKWAIGWKPYGRRPGAGYADLTQRLRQLVASAVPAGATVLVASKGDDALLEFPGRRGWHFPMDMDGGYAGYYPANGDDVIDHLLELRDRGAEYVVFPTTASWWLDHYHGLRDFLEDVCALVARVDDTAAVYALPQHRPSATP